MVFPDTRELKQLRFLRQVCKQEDDLFKKRPSRLNADRNHHMTPFLRLINCAVFFATAILLAGASYASAAESKHPRALPLPNCETDRVRFCNDRSDFPDIRSCLIDHDRDITRECRQELERFVQRKRPVPSSGGTALGAFGGPPIPSVSYDGRYGSNARLTEHKLQITAPLHATQTGTVSLSATGGTVHTGNSPVLISGKRVPIDLYRLEAGIQYFERLPGNKNWGLRGAVGSAGDAPFSRLDDTTFSLGASYGFPGSENGSWKLGIFMSNNNPIMNYLPIPGVSYLYKSETFTGMIGVPMLSLQWTPVFPWSFSLGAFGPNILAEASYGDIDRFQVFSGFSWGRQNYILREREHATDRLTIEEKKTAFGIRIPLGEPLLAEFQAGRAFDRSMYIGNGPFSKSGGSAAIAADWFLSTTLKLKY